MNLFNVLRLSFGPVLSVAILGACSARVETLLSAVGRDGGLFDSGGGESGTESKCALVDCSEGYRCAEATGACVKVGAPKNLCEKNGGVCSAADPADGYRVVEASSAEIYCAGSTDPNVRCIVPNTVQLCELDGACNVVVEQSSLSGKCVLDNLSFVPTGLCECNAGQVQHPSGKCGNPTSGGRMTRCVPAGGVAIHVKDCEPSGDGVIGSSYDYGPINDTTVCCFKPRSSCGGEYFECCGSDDKVVAKPDCFDGKLRCLQGSRCRGQ